MPNLAVALPPPTTVQRPQIAYVARVYYPFPSRKTSHEHVYLCDWNGRAKRVVSLPGQSCMSVAWLGHDRLVYDVWLGNPVKTEVWTVQLSTGRRRRLAGPGAYLDKDDVHQQPKDGSPVVGFNDGRALVTFDPWTCARRPISADKPGWSDPFRGPDKGFKSATVTSLDPKCPGSLTIKDETYEATLTCGSRRTTPAGAFFAGTWHPTSNRLWLTDYPSMHSQRLWQVDWKTCQVRPIFWSGYCLDWRPDRRKVVYTTQRDLLSYGPAKKVWGSELWVGDLISGATHSVLRGLAYYQDAAVQPDPVVRG